MHIPPPSGPEHSAWLSDWKSDLAGQNQAKYIQALHDGRITTANIFCGQLDIKNGQPIVDGFIIDHSLTGSGSFQSLDELKNFITACGQQTPPIHVKLSIGGAAGTNFGQCWNKLTHDNLADFGKALTNFCATTGAAGIDFDNEIDTLQTGQLVGQLAAEVKKINPQLDLSACVFPGGASQGWHPGSTGVLEGAKMPDGSCAFSNVYVMNYGNGDSVQTNENYVQDWHTYIQSLYGDKSPALSIGVDPTESGPSQGAANMKQWVSWASSQGYGTAIFDNQGIDDFLANHWGKQVLDDYNSSDAAQQIRNETLDNDQTHKPKKE